MNKEAVDEFVDSLVKRATTVLERFRSGHHPSESQLDALENALFPFTGENLCGHKIVEECDCYSEVNGKEKS